MASILGSLHTSFKSTGFPLGLSASEVCVGLKVTCGGLVVVLSVGWEGLEVVGMCGGMVGSGCGGRCVRLVSGGPYRDWMPRMSS